MGLLQPVFLAVLSRSWIVVFVLGKRFNSKYSFVCNEPLCIHIFVVLVCRKHVSAGRNVKKIVVLSCKCIRGKTETAFTNRRLWEVFFNFKWQIFNVKCSVAISSTVLTWKNDWKARRLTKISSNFERKFSPSIILTITLPRWAFLCISIV